MFCAHVCCLIRSVPASIPEQVLQSRTNQWLVYFLKLCLGLKILRLVFNVQTAEETTDHEPPVDLQPCCRTPHQCTDHIIRLFHRSVNRIHHPTRSPQMLTYRTTVVIVCVCVFVYSILCIVPVRHYLRLLLLLILEITSAVPRCSTASQYSFLPNLLLFPLLIFSSPSWCYRQNLFILHSVLDYSCKCVVFSKTSHHCKFLRVLS